MAETSSRALPRIAGSFSFRVAALYAGLFCASMLAFLLVVQFTATRIVSKQLNASVESELAGIRSDAGSSDPQAIARVINDVLLHPTGFFYVLQDKNGRYVAGNITPMRPIEGTRIPAHEHRRTMSPHAGSLRGRGVILPDGSFLFVGTSTPVLRDIRASVLEAGFWAAGGVVALGLVGGIIVSVVVLRRIETISRTSRAIMRGDLSRRIPVDDSNDEFGHLAVSLNAMLDRIEGLMLGMRRVSTDIAHDLRTPLSRLRQRLELARVKDLDKPLLKQVIDAAVVQIDSILGTFGALLRIAEVEAQFSAESFTRISLRHLLDHLVEAYEPSAEDERKHLSLTCEEDIAVLGDKELLEQLFANLIENALRHTPSGSHITVRLDVEGANPTAIVADDGPGIPPDRVEFVFGRFARLDQSRTTPGSGLGLSLVRAIAILHGASIKLADNKPGLACVVRFPPR